MVLLLMKLLLLCGCWQRVEGALLSRLLHKEVDLSLINRPADPVKVDEFPAVLMQHLPCLVAEVEGQWTLAIPEAAYADALDLVAQHLALLIQLIEADLEGLMSERRFF